MCEVFASVCTEAMSHLRSIAGCKERSGLGLWQSGRISRLLHVAEFCLLQGFSPSMMPRTLTYLEVKRGMGNAMSVPVVGMILLLLLLLLLLLPAACLGPAFYDAFHPIHLLPSTLYLLPSFCPLTSTIYPLSFSDLLMPQTLHFCANTHYAS